MHYHIPLSFSACLFVLIVCVWGGVSCRSGWLLKLTEAGVDFLILMLLLLPPLAYR